MHGMKKKKKSYAVAYKTFQSGGNCFRLSIEFVSAAYVCAIGKHVLYFMYEAMLYYTTYVKKKVIYFCLYKYTAITFPGLERIQFTSMKLYSEQNWREANIPITGYCPRFSLFASVHCTGENFKS